MKHTHFSSFSGTSFEEFSLLDERFIQKYNSLIHKLNFSEVQRRYGVFVQHFPVSNFLFRSEKYEFST